MTIAATVFYFIVPRNIIKYFTINVFLFKIYYIGLSESDINIQLLSTLLMGQRLFEMQRQSMDNKLKDIFELVLNIGDVIYKKIIYFYFRMGNLFLLFRTN